MRLGKRRDPYLQVKGISIRDIVEVNAPREGLKGVTGMVTGIAYGPRLKPYFRVRITQGIGQPTRSPWFRLQEITWLGDELYHLRQRGLVK